MSPQRQELFFDFAAIVSVLMAVSFMLGAGKNSLCLPLSGMYCTYGSDSKFRHFLEERGQAYVLAVSSQQRLWVGFSQKRVDAIGRELSPKEWCRLSAGDGMKGQRLYDWVGGQFGAPAEQGLTKWLLLRRSVEKPEELAYYLCLAPADTSLKELARAAGQRWSIECCFEAAKQETGLDEYEVRSWHGW